METRMRDCRDNFRRHLLAFLGVLALAAMLAAPAEAGGYRVQGWRGGYGYNYNYNYGYRAPVVRPGVWGYGNYYGGYRGYAPSYYNRGYYGSPGGYFAPRAPM